jgi:pimeloyl-ACP methyl ester carboxylesterase
MHWLFLAVLLFVLPIRNDLAVAELVSKYAPSPSAFVEVRGMQVHYRVQGKGPVLVLLHGMASSLHTWEGWVAVLEKNYTVVTLDLPGWGLTGPDPQKRYRTADQVDFLKAFTSQLGLTRFFLGGNSMGGNFAWNYALRYPADVLGLILVDAAGAPPVKAQQGGRPSYFSVVETPGLSAYFSKATPKGVFRSLLKQVYADDTKLSSALVDRYYALMRREGNRQAFIDRAAQRDDHTNRFAELKKLELPVLILWGAKDAWIPISDAHRFLKQLPNARLVVFDHLGHVPMEEDPATTVQAVVYWLAER